MPVMTIPAATTPPTVAEKEAARDILYKAAEDVTQGMWCKRHLYIDMNGDEITLTPGTHIETYQKAYRCAEGSVYLSAMQLFGNDNTSWSLAQAALHYVNLHAYNQGIYDHPDMSLWEYNDDWLPDDPFEAGQQLATLFRATADTL